MNPRSALWLGVVALALGLFVYVYEIEGERDRQAAREASSKVYADLKSDEIEALELETLDGIAARFERQDGRWWLVEPFEARAEATALDAIASALADLPREGRVAAGRPLDGFGLGGEARVVRFEAEGEVFGLRIGRTTPVGGHRYVARLAEDEVAYVESFRLNALNRNLSDLRDRRILDFESGRLATLELEWPEPGSDAGAFILRLERNESGDYQIVHPVWSEVDTEAVRDLLSDLAYLRAADFVDARTPEVERALERPALRFRWQLDSEPGAPDPGASGAVTLAGTFGGGRLMEGPTGALYLLAEDRLEDFPRSLDAYRFKRLSSFELASARVLELEFAPTALEPSRELEFAPTALEPSGELEFAPTALEPSRERDFAPTALEPSREPLRVRLSLTASGWGSTDGNFDPDAVSELVRSLSSLSADERVADGMGASERAALGLRPPMGRIVVKGASSEEAEGAVLAALEWGRMDPARGLFVRRSDRETVFLLAPASAEALPWSPEIWTRRFEVSSQTPTAGEVELEIDADRDFAREGSDDLGTFD